MPNVHARPALRLLLLLGALLAAMPAWGCGDASGVGRTVPVSGKVTLEDEPVTAKSTLVLFKPDATRGNSSPFEPVGAVDTDGNYRLTTKGKKGAPPGWYQVVVTAREEAPPVHPKTPQKQRPVVRSLLPARYGQAETSGLLIEVVENPEPGAYDLKLRP